MSEGDKTPSRYVVITESAATRDAEPLESPEAFEEVEVRPERSGDPEAVRRVVVEPEDRMAFRVGVNLLVLLFLGVGGYVLWHYIFG